MIDYLGDSMDIAIELLKDINIAQLLAIAIMGWFLYNRLDQKTERLRQDFKTDNEKLRQEIEKSRQDFKSDNEKLRQDIKTDNEKSHHELKLEIDQVRQEVIKLSSKVEDVDRRLCRIEGSLSSHGHCLFNQAHQEKKAQ
jgi:hypothetical protein